MSSRIPPLLEPYLALPSEASLILLTSVLGASTNWLVLRFLHSALVGSEISNSEVVGGAGDEPKVLLVSFMRDAAFWKENAKRLGLDLDKFAAKKRFAFIDGLSGLFTPKHGKPSSSGGNDKILVNSALNHISEKIHATIQAIKASSGGGKVLLVVDQLDLLLVAGGDDINAINIGETVLGFRDEVHSLVLSASADYSLVSGHQTPLEADHAAFLLSLAHQADYSMGVRLLDSGTARDVSGVVRITVGDNAAEHETAQKLEERELLYFIAGDGNVKVFERGQ